MPTEFKIPELGENVSAGDVVRILVKAGEPIEKDQPVLELETDKATIEVPSSVSGTVQEVKVKQGDKVKVGQVVFTLADSGAAEPDKPAAAKKGDKPGRAAKAPADAAAADAPAAKPADTAKPQPSGAAQDGGLSQAVTPDRTDDGGQTDGKPADREEADSEEAA